MEITTIITVLLSVAGILAFIISVITQLTKDISFLNKIPTSLQVIVTSLVLCLLTYFGYSAYAGISIQWYYVVGTIVGSFIVSYISMYGWEKASEIYDSFKYKN